MTDRSFVGIGLLLGILGGLGLGMAFGHVLIGLVIGAGLGVALGLIIDSGQHRKESQSDGGGSVSDWPGHEKDTDSGWDGGDGGGD